MTLRVAFAVLNAFIGEKGQKAKGTENFQWSHLHRSSWAGKLPLHLPVVMRLKSHPDKCFYFSLSQQLSAILDTETIFQVAFSTDVFWQRG